MSPKLLRAQFPLQRPEGSRIAWLLEIPLVLWNAEAKDRRNPQDSPMAPKALGAS